LNIFGFIGRNVFQRGLFLILSNEKNYIKHLFFCIFFYIISYIWVELIGITQKEVRKMMISVVYNKAKDKDGKVISDLQRAFEGKAEVKIFTEKITSFDLEKADIVIALGGDGTIIRASKAAAVYGIPVCGVNLGRIGFLAAIDPDEIQGAAKKLLSGDYVVEERMMLEAQIVSEGKITSVKALNDITISRGNCHKMIDVSIETADEHLDDFRADGVIVSTPTGSTAYSLSAGGPIIAPTMEVFLITPVCAYDLQSRSMVLTADDALTISAKGKQPASIEVDGAEIALLGKDDIINIIRSPQKAKIIKMNERSFLKTLRKKFCK